MSISPEEVTGTAIAGVPGWVRQEEVCHDGQQPFAVHRLPLLIQQEELLTAAVDQAAEVVFQGGDDVAELLDLVVRTRTGPA